MLTSLKFVQGGVSKKDMVPEMKHFAIEGGRVSSYNGVLALSAPIPFDIDCYPKADVLIKAIKNCEGTVKLSLTPAGKLRIVSGDFKALVNCIEKSEVHVQPDGVQIPLDGDGLLKAFKVLEPFVGDDASRPWANGVLLRNNCAYATCNIVLVQYWLGFSLPHVVNIPAAAVREVIRINEAPIHLQMTDKSITFHYADGRWIRTQLFSTEWPDIDPILERPSMPQPVDERIFDALARLKGFTDKSGRVMFGAGKVYTHDDEEEGGSVEVPGSTMQGIYTLDMMMLLKGIATHADFSTWPKPCMFSGGMLRGAIIGRSA